MAAPLALLVGGFIGLSVVNGGPASPDMGYVAYPTACPASAPNCERPAFPPPDYPRNAAGETYGPQRLARSAEELPDLVATRADNGRWGYVRRAEEDAASMQSPAPKHLFVYARDGRTIIGVHEILLPILDPPAGLAQMQAEPAGPPRTRSRRGRRSRLDLREVAPDSQLRPQTTSNRRVVSPSPRSVVRRCLSANVRFSTREAGQASWRQRCRSCVRSRSSAYLQLRRL